MIARDEDVVAMTRIGRVAALSERDGVRPDGVLGRALEAAQILVARLIAYVPARRGPRRPGLSASPSSPTAS